MNLIELRNREIQEKERSDRAQEDLANKQRMANIGSGVASTVASLLNPAVGAAVRVGAEGIKGAALQKYGDAVRATSAFKQASLSRRANSPTWYKRYPWLITNATKIPFFYYKGKYLLDDNGLAVRTPGLLKIKMLPAVPIENESTTSDVQANNTTSLKKAANDFMASVYQYIKVDRNYDAEEVAKYIITMDSCLIVIAKVTRLLQAIKNANSENAYLNKALPFAITDLAQGAGAIKTLTASVPTLESKLNDFIANVNILFIPDLPIFRRHMWLQGEVFKDDAKDTAEMYAFDFEKVHFPSFVGVGAISVGGSTVYPVTGLENQYAAGIDLTSLTTTQQYSALLDDLSEALINVRAQMAYVSADLAALYNVKDPNLRVHYIPLNLAGVEYAKLSPIQPYFNYEVMEIIHNTTLTAVPMPIVDTAPTGYTSSGVNWWYDSKYYRYSYGKIDGNGTTETRSLFKYLYAAANPTSVGTFTGSQVVIDAIQEESPSEDNILTMTRNVTTSSYSPSTGSSNGQHSACFKVDVHGTEIFTTGVLYTMANDTNTPGANSWTLSPLVINNWVATTTFVNNFRTGLSRFDYRPFIYVSGIDTGKFDMDGDITNPAIISRTDLSNLHIGCAISEFGLVNTSPMGDPSAMKTYNPNANGKSRDKRKNGRADASGTGDGNASK